MNNDIQEQNKRQVFFFPPVAFSFPVEGDH